MSGGLDRAGERLAQYLREQEVNAVTAWPVAPRKSLAQPVAAVSLRGVQAQPAGFQHYLGLRYDQEADRWEELYGRKARLTFGLDLYVRPESGEGALQEALEALTSACAGGGPEGLSITEFSCGETAYDPDSRLLKRQAQAVCAVYLYAVLREDGEFLDFEIRGERKS